MVSVPTLRMFLAKVRTCTATPEHLVNPQITRSWSLGLGLLKCMRLLCC